MVSVEGLCKDTASRGWLGKFQDTEMSQSCVISRSKNYLENFMCWNMTQWKNKMKKNIYTIFPFLSISSLNQAAKLCSVKNPMKQTKKLKRKKNEAYKSLKHNQGTQSLPKELVSWHSQEENGRSPVYGHDHRGPQT